MGSLFYLVLNMSITASAIGIVVALVRLALRGRLPALAQYALWGFVLLRLLLPFYLPSTASIFNPIGTYVTKVVSVPAGGARLTMSNMVAAANHYFPMQYKSSTLETAFNIAGIVWLAGTLLTALGAAVLYGLTALRFKQSMPVTDCVILKDCKAQLGIHRKVHLFASDTVSSPVVFGLLRQRIIIPNALVRGSDTLRYALLHELVHIRRHDSLRVILFLVVCVHWFNPLIWLFYYLAGQDMELACDASVLRRLSRPEQKGYALALAGLASGRQPLLAAAFGQSAIHRRITGIVKYKKLTWAAVGLTGLLLLALAVVFLSNPAG